MKRKRLILAAMIAIAPSMLAPANYIDPAIAAREKCKQYPAILGLNQEQINCREVDLTSFIENLAEQIEVGYKPLLNPKKTLPQKSTGGIGKAVGISGVIDESWAIEDQALLKQMYSNLGVDPTLLFGNSFSKDNIYKCVKDIIQDAGVGAIWLDLHGHGGSIYARDGRRNGYTCTRPICIDPNNPDHDLLRPYANENEIEWGILRNNNYISVLALGEIGVHIWFPRVDEITGIRLVGLVAVKYTASDFFLTQYGQVVSRIKKKTYLFNYTDSAGITDWRNIIPSPTKTWLQPDLAYLNPEPSLVQEIDLDLDLNHVPDIPMAMINSNGDNGDTIISMCMNVGRNFAQNRLFSSGTGDLNGDGFIGANGEWLDINNDGKNNPVYIPTVIKLGDGSLLTDLELQEILSSIPQEINLVMLFSFCNAGGFGNFLPNNNTIFWSSAPQDKDASSLSVYDSDSAFVKATQLTRINNFFVADTDTTNGLSWLEIFNYVYTFKKKYKHAYNRPESSRLADNPFAVPVAGPWPNSGQGLLAGQVLASSYAKTLVVKDNFGNPTVFNLSQNYPNPFNPETSIKYQLPKSCQVLLTVYNLMGQKVATLYDGVQNAGTYEAKWNSLDERGKAVSSGVYIYRFETAEFIKTAKMMLIR